MNTPSETSGIGLKGTSERQELSQRSLSLYTSPIILISRKCPPGSPIQETKLLYIVAQMPDMLGNKSSRTVNFWRIPKKEKMLAKLWLSKFFIGLNIRSGYYHMKLSPERRHKCPFTTIFGKYKFLSHTIEIAKG